MRKSPELTNFVNRSAICEVHLENIIEGVKDLGEYTRAFVVFRFKKAVIGQAWLPVEQGRISAVDLQSCLSQYAWPIWQRWFTQEEPVSISASVVVCTRNRSKDLAKGLPQLARLEEEGHEVLIVDNCPNNDLTKDLVSKYPAIRYILEPVPGLDTARNRGLRSTHGEIVAFTDDDAIVDEEWLPALLKNFQDPTVAVVTGITMPLELESEAQNWFEITNSFGRGYVRQRFDASTLNILATGQVGAGVNMAVRRSAMGEIGYFDEALDAGTPTLSGGDQEFFYRTLAAGYRIIYDPAALVWHRHRRTWEELRFTLYGYGVGVYAWWTRTLLTEGEWTVLYRATKWFLEHYGRNLIGSFLKRSDRMPIDLAWAELRGALVGPLRYLQSRQRIERRRACDSRKMSSASFESLNEDNQPTVKSNP